MSGRILKRWKHFLLFTLFHLLAEIGCLSAETANEYDESTELYNAQFHTEQFVFDPLGLNFESNRSEAGTESSKGSEDWIADPTAFLLTQKPRENRREAKKTPKLIINAYQSNFDRRYAQRLNYSEIYEDTRSFVQNLRSVKPSNYSFASFPSLNEIYEHLTVLETQSEGRAVVIPLQQHNLGWRIVHTIFGREILSIRISTKLVERREENPIMVVVAGIHGRDWYAIQSAIFVAEKLILNENVDISENLDWWIIPVFNPDGYELSRVSSEWRNWEKNLQGTRDVGENKCFGVDLDFAFEYQWLSCNDSPCDSNFPGEAPFSVPEVRGLRDTLEAFSDHLDSFVALKEGRQSLVYPFSDTFESPRHLQIIDEISNAAVKAFVKHVDGVYDYGQSSRLVEISAGYIEDWAKIHLGVEKSFAFYLGPTEKDRRELKSQHLMDHTKGTFELLKVIANGRLPRNSSNSSMKLSSSVTKILLNILFVLNLTNL